MTSATNSRVSGSHEIRHTTPISRNNNTNNNNTNNTNSTITNSTSTSTNNSNTNYTPSLKWIPQIRALPSKPNDSLQLEYIVSNLDNSRKLIGHVEDFTRSGEEYVGIVDERVNGALIRLNQVKYELDWVDDL
ncbi:uncharacterized protein RJT21DRAFT_21313 [Scheffersomyces amazonensis]|uniref:uncharacterized protein n=1 Tax=Scheffersomyces amazonensis TaxID=1078765 RepID=UPI00315C5A3D